MYVDVRVRNRTIRGPFLSTIALCFFFFSLSLSSLPSPSFNLFCRGETGRE